MLSGGKKKGKTPTRGKYWGERTNIDDPLNQGKGDIASEFKKVFALEDIEEQGIVED